jgi:multiple sugar transport system permease protein
LFYTTFNLPFGVFVMRNTFLQIPWELSEAAAVDGASTARTLLNMSYGSVGQVNFGYLEAGAVIAMVPCVLQYVGLQRYYIHGLTSRCGQGIASWRMRETTVRSDK